MVEYKVTKTNNCGHYGYGIDVFIDNNAVLSVENISDNLSDIAKLAQLCNELDIEPCHFDYLIEDYLTDFQI